MTDEEMRIRFKPKMVVKEELGGDFYYRCPWISCNKIVESNMNYCSNCGQKLEFPYGDYREDT